MTETMEGRLERFRSYAEAAVSGALTDGMPVPALAEAMRYSLVAGGKRVRPVLAMAFAEACGASFEAAIPFGMGVEMLHTYSLIHDDLPCMDNDDLRRGRPTNHKIYGEGIATIAGDALQAAAFRTILEAPLSAEMRADAALCLARAAGEKGMCAGQYLDLKAEKQAPDVEGLKEIERLKTAALLSASCELGVIAAGGGEKERDAARRYGLGIGIAFQIRDDVLDVRSTAEELGKPIGSDEAQGKSTFVSLLGMEEAEKAIARYTETAVSAVEGLRDPAFLIWFARSLAGRTK